MQDDELHLEGAPTGDQKDRLEDFLAELTFIGRKYGIALRDRDDALELVDVPTGNVVGVGLHLLRWYTPADSILDGVWLVDSMDGPVEQHQARDQSA